MSNSIDNNPVIKDICVLIIFEKFVLFSWWGEDGSHESELIDRDASVLLKEGEVVKASLRYNKDGKLHISKYWNPNRQGTDIQDHKYDEKKEQYVAKDLKDYTDYEEYDDKVIEYRPKHKKFKKRKSNY